MERLAADVVEMMMRKLLENLAGKQTRLTEGRATACDILPWVVATSMKSFESEREFGGEGYFSQ